LHDPTRLSDKTLAFDFLFRLKGHRRPDSFTGPQPHGNSAADRSGERAGIQGKRILVDIPDGIPRYPDHCGVVIPDFLSVEAPENPFISAPEPARHG